MDPIIGGAVIGGLSSLFGSAMSAGFSAKEAKKNRKFQERMSNTQYQRGMKDMRLAGLNPILAYKQGGAGTPSGAQAQIPDFGKSSAVGIQAAQAAASIQGIKLDNQAKALGIPELQYENTKSRAKRDAINLLDKGVRKGLTIGPDSSAKGKRQSINPASSAKSSGFFDWIKKADQKMWDTNPHNPSNR